MSLRSAAVATLSVVLPLTSAQSAAAQGAPIGQMTCTGQYGGLAYQGVVLADLWTQGPAAGGNYRRLMPYLMRGELHQIPGTVRLFGDMRDSFGSMVNFEVFLTGNVQGTGSVWVNGMRHRETYMQLALHNQGFDIYPETGGAASFNCQ